MKNYSSSLIKLVNDHCAKALEHYEKDTPYDASEMAYGVASHAVLEQVGKKKAVSQEDRQTVADAVVQTLITKGRTFRGRHEPPMQPDKAFMGRDVALRWLEFNELPPNAEYEIEIKVELGKDKRPFVALHDCVWLEKLTDEYGSRVTAVSRDWKGWQGRPEELETIQRKAQAITLLQHFSGVANLTDIRLEVCNLQTHAIFKKEITLDDQGLKLIDQWARDIDAVCSVVDRTREASPGAGCLGCPYNYMCNDRLMIAPVDREKIEDFALYLMHLEIERALTIKQLKAYQELPVPIDKGYVGWKTKPANKADENANVKIFNAWFADRDFKPTTESVLSLLSALKPSVGNIKAVAKVMFESLDDAMAEDFLEASIEKHNRRLFGVWKDKKQ